MNHPTKQQVQTVIDTFMAVKQKGIEQGITEFPVCMMNFSVPILGESICHGDYFSLKDGLSFEKAMNKLAQDLGFEHHGHLKIWGMDNPQIWGNAFADEMFTTCQAFGAQSDKELSLDSFIDHWKGVQSRLKE